MTKLSATTAIAASCPDRSALAPKAAQLLLGLSSRTRGRLTS